MGAACLRVHDVLKWPALAGWLGIKDDHRSQKKKQKYPVPCILPPRRALASYPQPPFCYNFSFFGAIFEPQLFGTDGIRGPGQQYPSPEVASGLGKGGAHSLKQAAPPQIVMARYPAVRRHAGRRPGCGHLSSGWMFEGGVRPPRYAFLTPLPGRRGHRHLPPPHSSKTNGIKFFPPRREAFRRHRGEDRASFSQTLEAEGDRRGLAGLEEPMRRRPIAPCPGFGLENLRPEKFAYRGRLRAWVT